MSQETIDFSFLAKLGQKTFEELKLLRREVAEVRTLSLQSYEFVKRVERRQAEMRDDLELAVKMELGGSVSHLQTILEGSLAKIEDKVENALDRIAAIEQNP
ncbi:MAG: hypothetical protein ACK4PN_00010 [Allorhizobium sp.]